MAPNIVRLEGAENVRDLGGYPTQSGAVTRHGRVFRAASLHELTLGDQARLAELGIVATYDLRGRDEVEEYPSSLPTTITPLHHPMTPDEARAFSMIDRIVAGELAEFTDQMMAAGYLSMLDKYGPVIGTVARAVGEGEPILFHCAAGKDRTGVVAMVLLGLAGVERDHLIDDYHLTEQHRRKGAGELRRQLLDAGIDPARFHTLGAAPRQVMALTLDGLDERWGSIDAYAESIGLDDHERAAVRTALTQR